MERVSFGVRALFFTQEEKKMNDRKVEWVITEVLRRLAEDNAGLTISPIDERPYLLTEKDILRDLAIFADEVFDAEAEQEESALVVKFHNGQTFRIIVKEEI